MIVGAAIVRNVAATVADMLASMKWVDKMVVVDDASDDGTRELLEAYRSHSRDWLEVWPSWFRSPMMPIVNGRRDTSRELIVRNDFLARLFDSWNESAVVLIDGDELMSCVLRSMIEERVLRRGINDSIALSCYHMVGDRHYIRVYEDVWNAERLIDPHVRVITRAYRYRAGAWSDLPDCFVAPTPRTLCLPEPIHIHLKFLLARAPIEGEFVRPCHVVALENQLPEDVRAILAKYV